MGEKITSKHFTVKRTIEGKNSTVDFVPKVKSHTAPEIAESYVNDLGDIIHILTNGNELAELDYLKHWGQPKGSINLKAKVVKINPNKFCLK